MAVDLSDRRREITEARWIPEPEVIEQALERGLEALLGPACSDDTSTMTSTVRTPESASAGRKSSGPSASESEQSSKRTSIGA